MQGEGAQPLVLKEEKICKRRKRRKTAPKSIKTSFQVHPAPKSLLKYTKGTFVGYFLHLRKFSNIELILKGATHK